MSETTKKNKKNKKKIKIPKPLEGRTLPKMFNPDGSLNKFYKKSSGGTNIIGEEFKDFKKGDLIKRLQKKFGKDKVNKNTSMKKLEKLMGKKEGGVTEGIEKIKAKTESMLSGGQAKLDKNKNDKIDAEDFKLLRQGKFSGGLMRELTDDMIGRAMPKVKGQKQKVEEMYMREKAKYDKPQNMRGGGIAIKGTKFKGVF